MAYLFTSESVSEGHPDKVADQISDALLDEFLAFDPKSKVACETLVTTGQVVLAGEVHTDTYIDVQKVATSHTRSSTFLPTSFQIRPREPSIRHRTVVRFCYTRHIMEPCAFRA